MICAIFRFRCINCEDHYLALPNIFLGLAGAVPPSKPESLLLVLIRIIEEAFNLFGSSLAVLFVCNSSSYSSDVVHSSLVSVSSVEPLSSLSLSSSLSSSSSSSG
uniref:Uncharacterized protein n=1 Tax=Glossina pallidipes TaxID=7398 RepID=A0A1B0AFB0_GLOPL